MAPADYGLGGVPSVSRGFGSVLEEEIMSSEVDEFDLDIRFHTTHDQWFLRPRPQHDAPDVQAGNTHEDTCAPQATCPADTCGLDCQTQTPPEATCGCNTIETCDQHADSCSPQACGITFAIGQYCEDETDGCEPPPNGPEPADTDNCVPTEDFDC
jgi:hypothetical protein